MKRTTSRAARVLRGHSGRRMASVTFIVLPGTVTFSTPWGSRPGIWPRIASSASMTWRLVACCRETGATRVQDPSRLSGLLVALLAHPQSSETAGDGASHDSPAVLRRQRSGPESDLRQSPGRIHTLHRCVPFPVLLLLYGMKDAKDLNRPEVEQ